MPHPTLRPIVRPSKSTKAPLPPLKTRSIELNHGAFPNFLKQLPTTVRLPAAKQQSNPVLYAVIGTWFEGDVIEATIKNCFANGCTKVFLVDNASPDDTCSVALEAGATLALKYHTQYYDDDFRLRLTNKVMAEITETEHLPDLWWLSLDADEFPCGPHGERILDYLITLDERYNCVGTETVDLFPTELPHYISGRHPADYMPSGIRRKGPFCDRHHWKHPLLRYRNGNFNINQSRGNHVPFVRDFEGAPYPFLIEPPEPITFFHAPMRTKEATGRRLEAMCGKQEKLHGHNRGSLDDAATQHNGSIKRWASFEHVYAGNWSQVELPHAQMYGNNIVGIALVPWAKLLTKVLDFPRWYDLENPTRSDSKIALPLLG